MYKVTIMPKCLSTGASMLVGTLWPFKKPIWTQTSLNARIAGNRAMLPFHAEFKDLDMLNAMVPTNPKTTTNSDGVAKWTRSPILLDLKQRKKSHVLIHSSVQTAEEITKQIPICVCSGDIDSIESGNKRSMLRSIKIGPSWFAP